jgi:hypothetical protein
VTLLNASKVVKPGPEDIDDPIPFVGLLLFAVSTQDHASRGGPHTGAKGMINLQSIHILLGNLRSLPFGST